MTFEELQQKVSTYFADKPVKKVYVFGSFLEKGDKANDIDLLAEVDYQHKPMPGFFERYDWTQDLIKILNKPVDLLPMEGISPRILGLIQTTKKQLYAAKG